MLGEPALRLRTRRFSGRITVPILFTEGETIGDSLDIARWADTRANASAKRAALFPEGRGEDVRRWNETSDRVLAAARVLAMRRIGESPAAQREGLPRVVPGFLRGLSGALTAPLLTWFAKKYRFDEVDLASRRASLDAALGEVRAGLAGREYLLDGFSYADVTIAVAMQLVSPVANEFIRLGKATRVCCTDEALAEKYADLVRWRDSVYAKHRARG